MSKYSPLREHLSGTRRENIPMTFEDIERVLGFRLPDSKKIRAWWSNNPTNNVMTNEWLAAGYKTEQVDIEGRRLVFRRIAPPAKEVPAHFNSDAAVELKPRRHPGFGLMKDVTTIDPDTDLTAPTGEGWASPA